MNNTTRENQKEIEAMLSFLGKILLPASILLPSLVLTHFTKASFGISSVLQAILINIGLFIVLYNFRSVLFKRIIRNYQNILGISKTLLVIRGISSLLTIIPLPFISSFILNIEFKIFLISNTLMSLTSIPNTTLVYSIALFFVHSVIIIALIFLLSLPIYLWKKKSKRNFAISILTLVLPVLIYYGSVHFYIKYQMNLWEDKLTTILTDIDNNRWRKEVFTKYMHPSALKYLENNEEFFSKMKNLKSLKGVTIKDYNKNAKNNTEQVNLVAIAGFGSEEKPSIAIVKVTFAKNDDKWLILGFNINAKEFYNKK